MGCGAAAPKRTWTGFWRLCRQKPVHVSVSRAKPWDVGSGFWRYAAKTGTTAPLCRSWTDSSLLCIIPITVFPTLSQCTDSQERSMKRREFLRGAATGVFGTVGAGVLAACGAPAAEPTAAPEVGEQPTAADAQAPAQSSSLPAIEWQMGTSWPISLDTIYGGATVMAERVSRADRRHVPDRDLPGWRAFPRH
jgi:hypothetical protein